ncbi:hypothetical protein Tcan_18716 [Toxocara canis]|uniref:C2H2-type domain-containing protein n=1 Tax=Toxocara canis TaxID=6265 RepID=A0A0B2UXX0_TOXCA|nr:hypothetical protein Tcan_18716 [Toxocara canis]
MNEVIAPVLSRRKQQKPARVIESMPTNAECSSPSSASVIVRVADLRCSQKEKANLPAGTVLCPLVASNSTDIDERSNREDKEIAGRLKLCNLDENSSQETEVIRIANAANGTSCGELVESDSNLYIRINRPVQRASDLRANLTSVSSKHQTEGTSSENGTGSPSTTSPTSASVPSMPIGQDASPASTSADVSFVAVAPHAIYLPVAFHDSGLSHMQVVGYPQIIIPVAVSRTTAHLYTPSLFVDETLSRGLEVPSSLSIGGTLLKLDRMTHPASCRPDVMPEPITAFHSLKKKMSTSPRAGMKRHSPIGDTKPLDLSLHVKEKRSLTTTKHELLSTQSSPTEPEKRYRCECGVSFNSETTLQGHRKYYCNNVANHAEVSREPQKKVLTRCQQCEFQPSSANQLAQHIRTNHSAVLAYVCQLCGYKGYSQRGIRSHLRTHSECCNGHNEELIKRHVCVVTPDSIKVECAECRKSFATKHLMKQHDCERTLKCD